MVLTDDVHPRKRVVVVSPADPFDRDRSRAATALDVIHVQSPYQGAAELLAGGVGALVIDLHLMARRHRSLLDIARDTGATILGYGALPAGLASEDLRGIHLVDPADLLGELTSTPPAASPAQAPEPPAPEAPVPPPETQPADQAPLLIERPAEPVAPPPAEPPTPRLTSYVPCQSVDLPVSPDEPLLAAAREFLGPSAAPAAGPANPRTITLSPTPNPHGADLDDLLDDA